MELPRSLSFVSYAVNGAGLGHVVRQCAIQRWIRRYCAFAGVRSQHWFLTTSEADSWLFHEGMAAFKLPSKSIVESAGISKPAYLAMAKTWVWNVLGGVRPDLLLVDTFPNGSFDELAAALDLARKRALVLRPVNAETAARPGFRELVGLYDRVIVPAAPGAEVPLPRERAVDTAFVGPVMRGERWEALSRADARRRLGAPDGAFVLLATGGGGGDESVGRLFAAVDEAVGHDPTIHVVFAAGPLFRGEPRRGPGRTWLTEPQLAEALPGVDAAIAGGGYNAVHELLFAGVPCALYAQPKIADDQEARVRGFVAAGAALHLGGLSAAPVRAALAVLRGPEAAALAAAARAAVPANNARVAAAALLELVLPRSIVRQAAEVLDDELMGRARAAGIEVGELVDLAVALAGTRAPADPAALELDDALELFEGAAVRGVPARALARVAGVLGRKLSGSLAASTGSAAAVARATERLLAHPLAAGQWSALAQLLEGLTTEREWPVARLAEELAALLDAGAASGASLYQLVEAGQRAQHEGDTPLPNAALLRRLRQGLAPSEGGAA